MKTRQNHHLTGRHMSRRAVMKKAVVLGAGFVVGAKLIGSQNVTAAELPHLQEDNVQARALGYRHDAATVDPNKYPAADPSAKNCANCQLFQAAEGSEWGGCPLFAGRAVNAQGWCTAWVQRLE
jgi:hypothetical protein